MISKSVISAFAASAAMLALTSPASGQRPQPTPDQRLERLEKQMQQMQRQVFPKGRPADTAGFSDDPAATQSSVLTLNQRLDALERQVADMLRQTEENGNRLQSLQGDLAKSRSDQDQRISAIEQRLTDAAAAVPAAGPGLAEGGPAAPATKPKPVPPKTVAEKPPVAGDPVATLPAGDPGEDAYTEGFRLWESGQYDSAITALRAFTSAYPKHRRASYANNLVGRALLDKGEPRAAAEALLANYRNNPKGERAPDSLFYLGQALMKLGQPAQACKAYSELDAVYGAKIRPDLQKLEADAKAQAQCG
ncbi:MAG TPA: tetratricopeptide repeat protein [Sphingomicrobium sp.]|nr:tetratricopeptide repeat protein [Sphingomicrobium sp.]